MNVWKIGSRWGNDGNEDSSVLDIFKKNNIVFTNKSVERIQNEVGLADLFAITDGITIKAIGRVANYPKELSEYSEIADFEDYQEQGAWAIRLHWLDLNERDYISYRQGAFHAVQGDAREKIIRLYTNYILPIYSNANFKVDKLVLNNFKNFKALTFEPKSGVNLLAGINGSGKTSILEGICVALGGFYYGKNATFQRNLDFDEIRIMGMDETGRTARAPFAMVDAFWHETQQAWSRSIKTETKSNTSKDVYWLAEYGKYIFQNFDTDKDVPPIIAPIFVYYSTERLHKDLQKRSLEYDKNLARHNGYLRWFEKGNITQTLEEWLGKAASSRATNNIKGIISKDLTLDAVEKSIRLLIGRFFNLAPDFDLKIFPEPYENNELYLGFGEESPKPLRMYSDGFKSMVYLLLDLIWRASMLNPWLEWELLKNKSHGVVVIDEIDLHLHPKWQTQVLRVLQEILPNVQFFITTHSSAVIANFNPREGKDQLFLLSNSKIDPYYGHYFGKEYGDIIRNIQETIDRNSVIQEKIDQLFRWIDDDDKTQYQPSLKELTNILGDDDPEIFRAKSLIDWNEYQKNESNAVHP